MPKKDLAASLLTGILFYHVVTTGTPGEFDTKKADFDAQMQWLSQSGLTVTR